jgi:hypothetical protein
MTLTKVLGLTHEHAYLELIDSNPIRNFNAPIMDISSPFHHDPTKLMLYELDAALDHHPFSSQS